jgi:SHS2 domain-containing protein
MTDVPSELRGHAVRPHTADAMIEAWAPTAAACYEEALAAFLELFVDTSATQPEEVASIDVGPSDPADLLVLLLEEVLTVVETRGVVPVDAEIVVDRDMLRGTLRVVPAVSVEQRGPVPKGVSYSELRFRFEHGQWRCRAIIDV